MFAESSSINILFHLIGLANFILQLNVLWQCDSFFLKKSVTILYIYRKIKKLVIYFEQGSRSPQMLNSKSMDENQFIPQTHAVLSSIFLKNTWVDLLLKTYKRVKSSGGYLLFSQEMGKTFTLRGVLVNWK